MLENRNKSKKLFFSYCATRSCRFQSKSAYEDIAVFLARAPNIYDLSLWFPELRIKCLWSFTLTRFFTWWNNVCTSAEISAHTSHQSEGGKGFFLQEMTRNFKSHFIYSFRNRKWKWGVFLKVCFYPFLTLIKKNSLNLYFWISKWNSNIHSFSFLLLGLLFFLLTSFSEQKIQT